MNKSKRKKNNNQKIQKTSGHWKMGGEERMTKKKKYIQTRVKSNMLNM